MPTKLELLAEAHGRGLLPPDKAAAFEEYQRRQGGQIEADVPRETKPEAQDFSFVEMLKNIPESASNIVGGTVEALMEPGQTAEALGRLGKGAVDKSFRLLSEEAARMTQEGGRPELAERLAVERTPDEATVEAVGQAIMDRYGSMEAFQKTVQEDPVGALMDLSGAGMAAGGAARVPALTKAAAAIDPFNLATKGTKVAAGKAIPKDMPTGMMESAAKFGTTVDPAKRKRLARTMLEEKIGPTAKGVEKRSALVNTLNNEIDTLIDTAETAGKSVPVDTVFRHFKSLRQKVGGPKIEGARDLRIVNKVAKDFKQHLEKTGKTSFTPSELQEFKKDLWQRVDFERGQGRAVKAKEESFYAAGRGAKEGIEEMVPEVGPVNLREGRLLELRKPLERAASRIENRDLIGLSAPAKIGGGTVVGGPAGTAVGTLAALLDAPKIKALTAQGLHNVQQTKLAELLNANVPMTVARQIAMQYGRENQ